IFPLTMMTPFPHSGPSSRPGDRMMRLSSGIVWISVALAAVPAAATTLMRRVPLELAATEAVRIVHATVVDVQSGRDEWGAAGPARAAGPLLVNGAGAPLVWSVIPVPFNPDRGTLGALANAAAVQAVADDFAVWAAVPTASISYANAGALPVDVTAANYLSY